MNKLIIVLSILLIGCGQVSKQIGEGTEPSPTPTKGIYTRYCDSFISDPIIDQKSAIAWLNKYVPTILQDADTDNIEANKGMITFRNGSGDAEDTACVVYTELRNINAPVKLLYNRLENKLIVYFIDSNTYIFEHSIYLPAGETYEEVTSIIVHSEYQ